MPVPKGKERLYGKVAGRMQNAGYSYEEAKNIADKAVSSKRSKGKAGKPESAMDKRSKAERLKAEKLHHRKKF